MGRKVVTDQQAGYSGGLNITGAQALLRPDQCRQMDNARLAVYGAALKRLGTMIVQTAAITTFDTTNSVYGGIYWPFQNFIAVSAAATNSTTNHLYTTSYGSFPRTWTDRGALTQYRPVIFTDGSTEVVYWAGRDAIVVQKWTAPGTIADLGAGTKGCVALCVYNDRLWGFGGVSTGVPLGNNLYYSELSSAVGSTGGDSIGDTGAGGGTIIVRTFGSSAIRALAAVNGSLLIFHEQGISVLTGWGQDDVQVQPQALNATIGMGTATADGICVANALGTGDLAYFITPLGLYVTNGGFVKPIGTPEKPDPVGQLLADGSIVISNVLVDFNRQFSEVWVGIKGTGVYIYNTILESWSGPFTGTYASGLRQIFEVVDTNGNPHLWRITYNGQPGTGVFVSESDRAATYKDDVTAAGTGGTAVTMTLKLHRLYAGDRSYAKSWRWVNILAHNNDTTASPTVVCSSQTGQSTHSMGVGIGFEKVYYVSPGGWGPFVDVTITDDGVAPSQYVVAGVEGHFLGFR